jgi:hypothetical protein
MQTGGGHPSAGTPHRCADDIVECLDFVLAEDTATRTSFFVKKRRFDFDPSIRKAEQRTAPLRGGLCPGGGLRPDGEVLRLDKVLRAAVRCRRRQASAKADRCFGNKIQSYVQENFFCISPFTKAKEEKSPFYFFFSKIMQKFFYLFFSSFCGVVKKIILTPL